MINHYIEEADFFGEITEESIVHAEKELGIAFPMGYRVFVHKFGLPHPYIVIENVDEFIYCLNTEGNDQVVRWDRISKEAVDRYSSFDAYLTDRFQEAIDNWE